MSQSINYYCPLSPANSTAVDNMDKEELIETAQQALEAYYQQARQEANYARIEDDKYRDNNTFIFMYKLPTSSQLLALAHGCLAKATCL